MTDATPMTHEEALGLNAVEMYVVKSLPPEQELRFEEHYFNCPECARGVDLLQSLPEAAAKWKRSEFAAAVKPDREPWWRRWAFPVLVPANAALLGIIFFQHFQLTQLAGSPGGAVAGPNTDIVAKLEQKGSAETVRLETRDASVELVLPADARSPRYRMEILRDGKQLLSEVLPAPSGSRLSLHTTRETLGNGSFEVFIYARTMDNDTDGPRFGPYTFNLEKAKNNAELQQ